MDGWMDGRSRPCNFIFTPTCSLQKSTTNVYGYFHHVITDAASSSASSAAAMASPAIVLSAEERELFETLLSVVRAFRGKKKTVLARPLPVVIPHG